LAYNGASQFKEESHSRWTLSFGAPGLQIALGCLSLLAAAAHGRIRRKIGRSALPHLPAPKLQACFKGIEFQSERRQRQSKTIQFFRAGVGSLAKRPL
jgi:hypothetical protein